MTYALRCLLCLLLLLSQAAFADDDSPQSDYPLAEIVNDEGGPVVISGQLHYSNALLPVA